CGAGIAFQRRAWCNTLAPDGSIEKRVVSLHDVWISGIQRQFLPDFAADLSQAPPRSRFASNGLAHFAAVCFWGGRLLGRRIAFRRNHPATGQSMEPATGGSNGSRPGWNGDLECALGEQQG